MELLSQSVVPEYARGVKQEACEFATDYIEPNAEEYFNEGKFPWDVIEAGRDAELVGQDIGEEYGGRGLDAVQMVAIAEEFFRADAGIALSLQLVSFGAEPIEKYGTEEQKKRFLRPVAQDGQISGLAVSEPETGSDLAGMQTKAEKNGDDWVLNGEKYWIGNGVEGDWMTLYAKTTSREKQHANYSLFIVPTDSEGYEAEHIPEKIGMRASKQAHITLTDCHIPSENLIGEEGDGFYMLADFFNTNRVIVASHGLGLAAAAIEEAWEFVHDREAFGQSISGFQAVQHTLADMRMEFESARALTYQAARQVRDDENPALWASMAKTKATEVAAHNAERAMQLHGGRSIFNDRRIARVYRDVRIPTVYEGTNEVQRNLIYRHS
jgi:acyl-CoA dehydrogenase